MVGGAARVQSYKGGGWGCTSTELQGWWVGAAEYRATRVVGGAEQVYRAARVVGVAEKYRAIYKSGGWD